MSGEGWDVAEICINGYVSTPSALSSPEQTQPHCSTCGAKTIQTC